MKEVNRSTAKLLMENPWWRPEYDGHIHGDFTIELPNAPPGMPQAMDEFDAAAFRAWMTDTVKSWEAELLELHSTPDENSFWAVSLVSGKVHWAGKDGVFESRRYDNLIFKDGKLFKLRELTDPLSWLKAIGAQVPLFRMDLYHPRIEEYLKAHPHNEAPATKEEPLDPSPEAVKARIDYTLSAYADAGDHFAATGRICRAPDQDARVWFLPPEMEEGYPPELMPRVEAWTVLSCLDLTFDSRGKHWATDDPLVYIGEYRCIGKTDWLGNNAPGRYRNRYWYILRFDELGRLKMCEEILNPINKLNSVGLSMPSFPYYF